MWSPLVVSTGFKNLFDRSIEAISEDAAIFKKQKSLFEDEDSKTTSQEVVIHDSFIGYRHY